VILVLVGREKETEEHVPDESGPKSGKMSTTFLMAWAVPL
jgi:hypothetical protein